MRWKITVANSAIILLTTVVSFALLKENLASVLADEGVRRSEAERAVSAVTNQLELDSLRLERWLTSRVRTALIRSVFESGTRQARGANATLRANSLREALSRDREAAGSTPSLIVFVDLEGVAIGRNDSSQMRGDNLGESYPSLMAAMRVGATSSHLWLNSKRSEQLSVSYAPVHSETGTLLGAVVVASPLGDERLRKLSAQTSGLELTLYRQLKEGASTVIALGQASGDIRPDQALSPAMLAAASRSMAGRRVVLDEGDQLIAAQRLGGLNESGAFVVARAKKTVILGLAGLLWPLAVAAGFGLILVASAAALLANYISQPIAELEEGLLSVINGRTNHRFELEHNELGGLVSHLNSLLNSLMGVPEVDHTGRTSFPAGAAYKDMDDP